MYPAFGTFSILENMSVNAVEPQEWPYFLFYD